MRSALLIGLGIIVGTTFSSLVALAWTGPGASPPGGNVSAPVNVGVTSQVKNGDIGVNNISAFGNALLSGLGVGTGRYLNFDYTSGGTSGTGSAGYGMRDNAGTLEFKNLGGSWASLQTTINNLVGGSGQWTTSGNNIYNSNSGNVGIEITNPTYKLQVSGNAYVSDEYIAARSLWASQLGRLGPQFVIGTCGGEMYYGCPDGSIMVGMGGDYGCGGYIMCQWINQ